MVKEELFFVLELRMLHPFLVAFLVVTYEASTLLVTLKLIDGQQGNIISG